VNRDDHLIFESYHRDRSDYLKSYSDKIRYAVFDAVIEAAQDLTNNIIISIDDIKLILDDHEDDVENYIKHNKSLLPGETSIAIDFYWDWLPNSKDKDVLNYYIMRNKIKPEDQQTGVDLLNI
jgi:Mg2+ and Co2+ transporter CorA